MDWAPRGGPHPDYAGLLFKLMKVKSNKAPHAGLKIGVGWYRGASAMDPLNQLNAFNLLVCFFGFKRWYQIFREEEIPGLAR